MTDNKEQTLLQRIEESRPEKVLIWGLGGAGFAVSFGDELLYIDPYLSNPDPTRPFHRAVPAPFLPSEISWATSVISTHEHNDHCDPATLRSFAERTQARFYGPESSAIKAESNGYPRSRIVTVAPGQNLQLSKSFSLEVFASNDPYEVHAVTYLLKTPRGSIFHSGDTNYFDGFGRIGTTHRVDVALINYGKQIPDPTKPYYMDAASVAKAAGDMKAKIVVPMHWNLWLEGKDDPMKVESEILRLKPVPVFKVVDVGSVLEL